MRLSKKSQELVEEEFPDNSSNPVKFDQVKSEFQFSVDNCRVYVEKDENYGYYYFSASFKKPPLLQKIKGTLDSETKKKKFIFEVYQDVSLSRRSCDVKKELDFFENYILQHRKMYPGEIEVVFHTFSNSVHKRIWKIIFLSSPENSSMQEKLVCGESQEEKFRKMRECFLENQNRSDGGTSLPLQEISLRSANHEEDIPLYYFLFSDGVCSFGSSDLGRSLHQTTFNHPVICINSSENSRLNVLKLIAEKSGGYFIDLSNPLSSSFSSNDSISSTKDEQEEQEGGTRESIGQLFFKRIILNVNLKNRRNSVRNVVCTPSRSVKEVYYDSHGQIIEVYGIILNPEDEPSVELEFDDPSTNSFKVVFSKDYFTSPPSYSAIHTLWAKQKIEHLSHFPKKNQKIIERLRIKHRIETDKIPSPSVLSELSEFQEHQSLPPLHLKCIKKEYMNPIDEKEEYERERVIQKIDYVVKKWNQRIAWHRRDFRNEYTFSRRKEQEISRNNEFGLPDHQYNELRSVFEMFDQNGNGHLTKGDIRNALNQLGTNPLEEELDEMWKEFGHIPDEGVPFENFVRVMGPALSTDREQELREAFSLVDIDRTGKVDAEELKQVSKMLVGEDLSMEELKEMLNCLDMDEDGELGFDEFRRLLLGTGVSSSSQSKNDLSIRSYSNKLPSNECRSFIEVKSFNLECQKLYLDLIKSSETPYDEYLKQRELGGFENNPSFYLDVSDLFWNLQLQQEREEQKEEEEEEVEGEGEDGDENGNNFCEMAVLVLSNIIELELDNVQLYRTVGYQLYQFKNYELSTMIFEHVLSLRDEEPQSYRDLALSLQKQIDNVKNKKDDDGDLQSKRVRIAKLLYKVITGKWDERYDGIELTATLELNHFLLGRSNPLSLDEKDRIISEVNIDLRLLFSMDCDLRISMSWDTNMTDIDLHVRDMSCNEHYHYCCLNGSRGGLLSRDFVGGYGPEEFIQKTVWYVDDEGEKNCNEEKLEEKKKSKQVVVKFEVSAKYFANHQKSLTGGTTILCTFFTNYLRVNEKMETVTVRLMDTEDEVEVCEIGFVIV